MKRFLATAIMFAAILAPLATAHAGVFRQFSYQGVLTDDLGALLPDGNYALTVRLYDAASGGNLVFFEPHPAVALSKGGFSIMVGSINDMADVDVNRPLWLSLQVGANPELGPRIALGSSPYAMGLNLPYVGRDSLGGAMVQLRNAGTGPSLVAEGTAHVGSQDVAGRLAVRGPTGGTNDLVVLQPYTGFGGGGGEIQALYNDGSIYAFLEPDILGLGGFLNIDRGDGLSGFTLDGSSSNSSPRMSISGLSSNIVFNTGTTGDAAVALPPSSLRAVELGDEAGIAHRSENTFNQLTGGVSSILSRSFLAPADGYVVVSGNATLGVQHTAGSFTRTIMAVDDHIPGSITGPTYTLFEKATADASTTQYVPGHCVGVWPVTEATLYTFHLLGQEVSPGAVGQGFMSNPNLTIQYFPTAYGTVTSSLATGEISKTRTAGQTADEIAAERGEAARVNEARVRKELDALRAQVESLQAELANDPQASGRRKP